MFNRTPTKRSAIASLVILATITFGVSSPLALTSDSSTSKQRASEHPYAGLSGSRFWQAVERDRLSPTQMPGATGLAHRPSPHGPFRHDPALAIPRHAYSPFDRETVHCPSGGCEYLDGVLLVKLKPRRDEGFATMGERGTVSAPSALDAFLDQLPVQTMERVFPNAVAPAAGAMVETPRGDWIPQPDLTRWHRITLRADGPESGQFTQSGKAAAADLDLQETLRTLRTFEEVEYAEPEYLFRTIGQPDEVAAAVAAVASGPKVSTQSVTAASDRFNDPEIGRQWHLAAANVPAAWQYLEDQNKPAGGNADIVVAVIDTGVDYTHPDLVNSMWVNPAELNGTAGQDSDGNGYIDDIHGATVIAGALSGDPMDDHGHGTHVAGIIAAQGNNNEGGVGVAPNVKIMAIKAAQYSGVLNSSDIARGIKYAIDNGADVINMSFGGYARSQLVEDALANAFGVAVLVAAAGNDGRPNLPVSVCGLRAANVYPASYNWVLGVMSRNESPNEDGDFLSGFSNYDCVANDLQEYELMAPGAGIYSTLPFEGYGAWSGTSMAAPVVAGIAALARTRWPDKSVYSSRFIMGQLAATGPMVQAYTPLRAPPVFFANADALQALTSVPQPELSYLEHWLFDTTDIHSDNNPNGIVDAGETIELAVVIRNHWGRADNVEVKLEAWAPGAVQADPWVEMLVDTVDYGAVGSFNQKSNGFVLDEDGVPIGVVAPFRFRTSPDTPNDHLIVFRLTITGDNGYDSSAASVSSQSNFYQLVQSGTELPRFIETDTTLDDSRLWLVPNGVLVREGATLTIGPGARVQFFTTDPSDPFAESYRPKLQVEGTLAIAGTAEAPVELFSGLLYQSYPVVIRPAGSGRVHMDYARVLNPVIGWRSFYDESPVANSPIASISNSYFTQAISNCIKRFARWETPGWFEECRQGPVVSAVEVQTSIFRELGYFGGGSGEAVVDTNSFVNTSLFDGVYATLRNDAADSVFLRNHRRNNWGWHRIDYVDNSSFRQSSSIENASFLKSAFRDEYAGYTYFSIAGMETTWNKQLANHRVVDRFARTLGGNLVWIQDQQENDFLQNFISTFTESNFQLHYGDMDCGQDNCWSLFNQWPTIGAVRGTADPAARYEWLGGQAFNYENWDSCCTDRAGHHAVIDQWSGSWRPATANRNPFLIKLPGSVSEAQLATARDTFIAERRYSSMTNNAFLNHWLDMNPNHWMRFIMEGGPNQLASIAHNYWGTQSTRLIDAAIIDANDNFNLGVLHYQPILTEAPKSAYPFVVDIEVANSAGVTNQVGAEAISFTVRFNRDMDRDVDPLVSFGPDVPYTDFIIPGEWHDARTWVGEFTTTPMTGDGWQYMRVIGAVAADNPWLVTGNDYARFRFEVATSGTEAMNLQASGEEGLIRLSWSQDDFDTLAGYNLYRAPVGSDVYDRVNVATVPQGMTTWEDQAVEPGQPYQYYFTVVRTDLTESDPSNFAQATALDTVPPVISHTPIASADVGLPLTIRANVTDNVSVEEVRLYFRAIGASTWQNRAMLLVDGRYSVTLEGSLVQSPGLEYFIRASDGRNETNSALMSDPHRIAVDDVPVITGISPTVGPESGGTEVTISGSNFLAGATVSVGRSSCAVSSITSTSIRCTTSSHIPERVQVMVTNASGASGILTNAFTYRSGSADLSLPEISVPRNQTVQIPVSLANASGLVSAQWTVSFDSNVLRATGASIGNLSAGWAVSSNTNQSGQITVSMATGSGAVTGDGIIARLNFEIIGAAGATSALTVSQVKLNNDAIPVNIGHGQVTVETAFAISGRAQYWQSNRPVDGAAVLMANDPNNRPSIVADTGSNGNYQVFAPAGNHSVMLRHSVANNGISAFDAALVLGHASGSAPLTGHAATAADVNRDGQVNAHDAFLILQHAAGLSTLPFQNAGQVWVFDPEMRSFNGLNQDQTEQNFTAILLGDPSGNWNEQQTLGIQSLSSQTAAFSLTDATGKQHDQISSVLSLTEASSGFRALELDFSYDPALFEVLSVTAKDGLEGWLVESNLSEPGQIRVVAASAQALSTPAALFELEFKVRVAGNHSSILTLEAADIDEGRLTSQPVSSTLKIGLGESIFHDDFRKQP